MLHDPTRDAAQSLVGVGEWEVGDDEPAARLQRDQDVGGDQVDVTALVHGDVVDHRCGRLVQAQRFQGAADQTDPVGEAGVGDPPTGLVDRVAVAVDADHLAGRVGLGQPDDPYAGPAGAVHHPAAGGEPFSQPRHLLQPAWDQACIEGGAGAGDRGDPVGLVWSHHERSPEARLASKRSKTSGCSNVVKTPPR